MQHFERDFGVDGAPVKLIKLEQNYRSHGHILDAANALIKHNQGRLGKNLWTADAEGEPVRAFAAPSDIDEAAFIVDVVKGLVADGVSPAEVAVLYRSNAQSRVLEHALFNAGDAVPRLRRHALFRARRSQARARLPAADRGARRRRRVPARRQLPAARHRRADARDAAGARARDGHEPVAGGVQPARSAARRARASPRSSR